MPPLQGPAPFVTLTQQGNALNIETNLTGPGALAAVRTLLQEGLHVVTVAEVRAAVPGESTILRVAGLDGLLKR